MVYGFTIVRDFIPFGDPIPNITNVTAGSAPGNAMGGGNLESIFNAAADLWEAAIMDDFTTTIHFGWAPLSGAAARTDNTSFNNLVSSVRFDNDGTTAWFLDMTPEDSSEWSQFNESSEDLGGGELNTGRWVTSPTGNAVSRADLFTVALHEIGHSLGMSSSIFSFNNVEIVDGDIDITSPRPFAGSQLPVANGAHLQLPNALMESTTTPGVRTFLSEADILGVAQASGFTNVNLDPLDGTSHIPEPSSVALLLMGSIIMLSNRPFRERRYDSG